MIDTLTATLALPNLLTSLSKLKKELAAHEKKKQNKCS